MARSQSLRLSTQPRRPTSFEFLLLTHRRTSQGRIGRVFSREQGPGPEDGQTVRDRNRERKLSLRIRL